MMPLVSSVLAPVPWQIIIPVRGGPVGKTRLASIEGRTLTGPERVDLALAMAQDTVTAAIASEVGPVRILTADEQVGILAFELGVPIVLDDGRGLNVELVRTGRFFFDGTISSDGVAFLLGDLPALRPEDLRAALEEAVTRGGGRAFVPDGEGTGTALAAFHPAAGPIRLAFGPDSARQHEDLGLAAVGIGLDRLRCDVDTPQAWERALALGLGPATQTARAQILARPRPRPCPRA